MKGYSNMINLDATDLRILRIIQKRGRISNSDLSMEINLSASACHRRVSRLESNKVVKNYVALLDPIKVNLNVFILITIASI